MQKIGILNTSEENIQILNALGLTRAQAKIYLTLLAIGPTTIREIAHVSAIARPDIYRVLAELQELGIVEKIVALPTKIKPLPIEDAIALLMLRKTKESMDLHKKASKLVERLKEKTNAKMHTEDNQFILIQGEAVELELEKLLEKSTDSLSIMISRTKILQWIVNQYTNIKKALERKVTIRIIAEEPDESNASKKVQALKKFPNFEWRHVIASPTVGFKICDNKEILLTTSQLEQINYGTVYSTNSSLITLAQNYFDSAWFSAIEPQDQKFKHDSRQFDYLFSNLASLFTYNKMIFGAQGKPVDFVILEANKAFMEQSKIGKNFLGERGSKIFKLSWKNFMASLEKKWPTISSGKSVRFEYFSVYLKKWFSVLSYSPEKGYFACIFEDITERKKAEKALAESEKKYRTLVEQSTQGLLLGQGPIPHVVFANSAMETISGYSVQELASLTFQQVLGLVHPDDRELFFTRFKERLQGKPTPTRYVFRGIKKDGTIIWVEVSSALIEYGGQPTVQAVFEDITERKKAEEALIESEANYRNLINGMNETAWVIDFNGNFVAVNDATVKTLGYSREELLTMGLKDIDKAYSKEEFKNHLKSMPATGTEFFEAVHTAKDGTEIPVEISSSLITYHGEQAKLSISRNITERKKVLEALKESKEIFSKAFQSSPAMLTITRVSDNQIIDVNDAFLNLLGFTREEVVGHTSEELNFFPDYDSREKMVSKVLQQGRVSNYELIYHTKTRKKLRLLASVELVNIHRERHLLASHLDATNHNPIAEK